MKREYTTAASATVCRDFPIAHLEGRVLQLEFSNLQDIFISTKFCLGIFLASFLKNKMAATAVFSNGHEGVLHFLGLFVISES